MGTTIVGLLALVQASLLSTAAIEDASVLETGVPRTVAIDPSSGPRRLTWTSTTAGSVCVTASSPSLRPSLLVSAEGVDSLEQRGNGDPPSACVLAPTEAGVSWTIEVGAVDADASGSIEVRCIELPETDATRAAVERANSSLERSAELAAAGDPAAARAQITRAVAELLAVEGAITSMSAGTVLSALGAAAAKWGESAVAVEARGFVVRQFESVVPDDDARLAAARVNLATALYASGRLVESRRLLERVLDVRRRTLDADDPRLASVRSNLAVTLLELGDYAAARTTLEDVIATLQRTIAADDPRLVAARQNLGSVLKALGDLDGARREFVAVLAAREARAESDPRSVAQARANLALVQADLGELTAACEQLRRVVLMLAQELGDDHPDVATARMNLAAKLEATGDVGTARILTERVLAVWESTLADDHLDLAWARTTLAVTLRKQGDLAGAQALIERALAVLSKRLPEHHPNVLQTRAQLAVTLIQRGEPARARDILDAVHAGLATMLTPDHHDLQTARLNLAAACAESGEFDRARELAQGVVESRMRTLPEGHVDIARARLSLARVMAPDSEPRLRLDAYRSALRELERALPQDHADVALARNAASWAAMRTGDEDAVTVLIRDAQDSQRRVFAAGLVERGEREATAAASSLLAVAKQLAVLGAGCGTLAPMRECDALAFAMVDAYRSIPWRAGALARAAPADDASAVAIRRASADVARLAMQPDRRDAYFDAVRALDALRTRRVDALAADDALGPWLELSSSEALAAALPIGAKGVLFARWTRVTLDPRDARRDAREDVLSAYVLDPDATVDRVDLGSYARVFDAVESWRAAVAVEDEELERETGTALRTLLFDPLVPRLGEAKRVVVVLDDPVHSIALDALPWRDGVVGDAYRIQVRTCFAELLMRSAAEPAGPARKLVAIGAVAFDAGVPEGSSTRGTVSFDPLPATESEVRGVASLHADTLGEGVPAIVLVGDDATSDALFAHAAEARFLHVATHGYFEPLPEFASQDARTAPLVSETWLESSGTDVDVLSPAVCSGLALAGANRPLDAAGTASGRVTAQELATLDLRGCELAVLSACDTSVGVVRAGQGTASLQAALHAAGARSVVTSLWQVPDEATARLMTEFYRRLWEHGDSKADALWSAKRSLRDATQEDGSRAYSTRAWAGFVLTGEP